MDTEGADTLGVQAHWRCRNTEGAGTLEVQARHCRNTEEADIGPKRQKGGVADMGLTGCLEHQLIGNMPWW